MRSILIGIFVLSAWIVVLPHAHAQAGAQNQGHPCPLRSAIGSRHKPRLGTTRGLRKIA
jgi:hypothetical protein